MENYLETSQVGPHGKAPGLKVKLLSEANGMKIYVLVFKEGDEVLTGIQDFANQYKVKSAFFTAIGAFSKATSAWYDFAKKAYKVNHINQQVELVSLVGNISSFNDKPLVHAHFSAGYPDGKVEGGHLIEAFTSPTVELFVTVTDTPIYKKEDSHTDLKLMDLN